MGDQIDWGMSQLFNWSFSVKLKAYSFYLVFTLSLLFFGARVWAQGADTKTATPALQNEKAPLPELAESEKKSEGPAKNPEPVAHPSVPEKSVLGVTSVNDQGSDEILEKEITSVPILYKEKTFFRLPYESEAEKKVALERAKSAGLALDKALSVDEPFSPDSRLVDVNQKNRKLIEVRVRGYKILELTDRDRAAAGFLTMEEYLDYSSREIINFVSQTADRLKIQKFALQFFLSVFFGLLGFVVFRRVIILFNQADRLIDSKKDRLRPLTFLSETLISGQTLGGLLASLLIVGRMLTYLVVILTTLAAIFGQFSFTRNLMGTFFAELLEGTFKVFQSLFESIPGLILAFSLLFILQLSLKVLQLYLKGVRSGRISWKFLQENRTLVVGFWGPVILIVFFLPLTVASVFGRFNTPLEIILIGAAIVVVLSQLPVLASLAAGSFIVWQGHIKLGEWLQVGQDRGEVTDINLYKVTLVPSKGGQIHIPMIRLLFQTYSESREVPQREFYFGLKRNLSLKETLNQLNQFFPKELNVQLSCRAMNAEEYFIRLKTTAHRPEEKLALFDVLSEAHNQNQIHLTETLREILH